MQPIVLQPVKIAGWQPAAHRFPALSLSQGQTNPPSQATVTAPTKAALIDSPLFNFFVYGLGAFATGSLAFGAASKNATTSATLLGIVTGGLALAAGYNLYSSKT